MGLREGKFLDAGKGNPYPPFPTSTIHLAGGEPGVSPGPEPEP